jgi:hypothetical protein
MAAQRVGHPPNLTNPQTLNLYAMVSDNPESFADLDGHECYVTSGITCTHPKKRKVPKKPGEGSGKDKTGTGTDPSPTQQAQQPSQQNQQPDNTKKQSQTPNSCSQACQTRRKAAWAKLIADAVLFATVFVPDGESEGVELEAEAAALADKADAEAAAEEAAAEETAGGGPGAAKDRTPTGNVDRLDSLRQAQKSTNKSSKGQYNMGTKRTEQDIDHTNRQQFQSSKDLDEDPDR